jgi:periplasmic mercuric ion binding protein
MKKMILLCLLIFTAISVDAQDKTSKKDKKSKKDVTTEVSTTQTVVIKTNIYCSHFQQCGGGAPRVQTGLSQVAGISAVVIDDKAMTITVTYDSSVTSPEAIRTAISQLGLDADDVKADPEAYAKLDGCCKKR